MVGRSDSRDPAPDARAAYARYARSLPRLGREHGNDDRLLLAGPEGRPGGRDIARDDRRRGGRLLYRGYPIGELVARGTLRPGRRAAVDGRLAADAHLSCAPLPPAVLDRPARACPPSTNPMDALRTAVSAWGAADGPGWPPTVEQARAITALAPTALAAFARLRQGLEAVEPDPSLGLAAGFLYQLTGERPDAGLGARPRRLLHRRRRARLQRLDVHGARDQLDPFGHRVARSAAPSAR